MKKYYLIFIVSILMSIGSQAQDFTSGIRAGISSSQIHGDNLQGFNIAGINAGFFVRRETSDVTAYQMELSFLQKGARKPSNPKQGDYTYYKIRTNYINIPISFQYRNQKNLGLEAGMFFDFFINKTEEDQIGILPNDPSIPEFHRLDFGGHLGFNYYLGGKWTFNMRGALSLWPSRSFANGQTQFLRWGQHNVVLNFAFHYSFN